MSKTAGVRLLATLEAELRGLAASADNAELTRRLGETAALAGAARLTLTEPARRAEHAEHLAGHVPTAELVRAELEIRFGARAGGASSEVIGAVEDGSADRDAADPAAVTSYLRSRSHGTPDDAAHSVRVLEGGYSKQTLLVGACLAGVEREIVFRQVLRGRKAQSLAPEFGVLRTLHARGLPVPEPLWIEPEENAIGGPFFATARVLGVNVGDVWGAAEASRKLCLDVAQVYARIHAVDVGDAELPVSPRVTDEELGAMVDWVARTIEVRGAAEDPVLVALVAWLREHLPSSAPRAAILHGDAAFSNLLVEGDRVSAVLDWEYAHAGDPAEELAYLRGSIEPILPWAEFVEGYVAAGGQTPDEERLRFFEVWAHTWRYVGCLGLAAHFEKTGRYSSALAAHVLGPRFLIAAADLAFASVRTPAAITSPNGGVA